MKMHSVGEDQTIWWQILKYVTDDEIYQQLGEVENNLDLGEDYDMIINWVKNAVISVPRTDDLLEDNEDA